MPDDWNSYLCKVNNVLASVFLDLGLRNLLPDSDRPNLLWVWVDLKWPRPDGLSASSEFTTLSSIEDNLTRTLRERLDAFFCGGITTDGRREFYYYAPGSKHFNAIVKDALSQFRDYEFECGHKADPEWRQYLDVLYPSDEDRQRIENHKVLELLETKSDALRQPRDVWHWIYFRTERAREEFRNATTPLEYRVQSQSQVDRSGFPFGLCIVRFQSVSETEIDEAVTELFCLARKHDGDYDGWETQVIPQVE